MRLTTAEVAAATGGRVVGPDAEVDGASIDSRSIEIGELFVPVVATRDGHDFVDDAVDRGAPAYLTARGVVCDRATAIEVADTGRALAYLGRLARRRLPERVVGITGSVGKTTVKDLAAGAVASRFRTVASRRNFNNELGVPLTLLAAPDDTEAAVVEMGARGKGHIALLCEIARPTVGVVTVVAPAHTELFGTVDDVAVAKGELVESLPPSGTAVLNADDPRVRAMASRTPASTVLLFGRGSGADITAGPVSLDADLRPRFTVQTPWGSADVLVPARGEHQVTNALAAVAIALACDVPLDNAVKGIEQAELSPWRMEVRRTPAGTLVINDAYNASPASMKAALETLARVDVSGERVAVLGVMAELGDRSPDDHREVAALARDLGLRLVAVGTDLYGVAPVDGVDAVVAAVGDLGPDDAVLVKGSRAAGLERVAQRLTAGEG